MSDLRLIFLVSVNFLSGIGMMLNAILIWLIISKTPKILAEYKIILLQNLFVDLQFNAVNFIVKAQTEYKNGAFYLLGSGLLNDLQYSLSFGMLSFFVFSLFCCVTTIPVQFIYRYFIIIRGRQLTKIEYSGLLITSFFGPFCVAGIWIYVECFENNPKELEKKASFLAADPLYFRGVPFFIATDNHQFSFIYSSASGYLMVLISYGITLICFWKVWKELKQNYYRFSSATRRLQSQMTKTMTFQAIVPLIFIIIPISAAISASIASVNISGLGIMLNFICCWVPIVNPALTTFSIKSYRITLLAFFKKFLIWLFYLKFVKKTVNVSN